MTPATDPQHAFLRHTLATLAYRGAQAVRGAPESFATFRVGDSSRTPAEIVAHMADLFDWAFSLAEGQQDWHPAPPTSWDAEVHRFFTALTRFDAILATEQPLTLPAERLFQGPIADALTHVGQLNQLRRLAGSPVQGENYVAADVEVGRVGVEQAAAKVEFE
jgi:hypothetical protein